VSRVLKAAIQNCAATICRNASPNSVMRCATARAPAGPVRVLALAYGGQCTDDQAHIGKQQPRQPGAARDGQRAGLGAQVIGDHALHLGGTLGQLQGKVGREFEAQFAHRLGHVFQQLAVLLGCLDQVGARMGQPQPQQPQGQQHDQGCCCHFGPMRGGSAAARRQSSAG
jgi:hypothetical protein